MSLREEIVPYIDGNGLVAPNLIPVGQVQASDNGVLFTSLYYILLSRNDNNRVEKSDVDNYTLLISKCMNGNVLHRAPQQFSSYDENDDYQGLFAGCSHMGITNFPGQIIRSPWQLLRTRQIHLFYAALICVRIPSFMLFPLNVLSAIIIATSCMFTDKNDATSRILPWCFINATYRDSFLMKLASKLWFNRLLNAFPGGMKDIFTGYFQAGHPLAKYMDKGLL